MNHHLLLAHITPLDIAAAAAMLSAWRMAVAAVDGWRMVVARLRRIR